MQTRTYGDLFKLIKSLAGVSAFTDDEKLNIGSLINRRYSKAYNTSPSWARYITVSEPRDINSYTLSTSATASVNQNYKLLGQSSGTGSKAGTNVYAGVTTATVIIYKNSSDAWIVATGGATSVATDGDINVDTTGSAVHTEQDTNKKDKLEDVESWSATLLVEPKNLIPYAQTGKNTIAEYVRIHRKRAFLNLSRLEYDFYVDVAGANILDIASNVDNKAFVTYKKTLTLFTTSTDHENSTEEVPLEFFNYLAHASYADFLRMDGQHGKALTEEQLADDYLFTELEKIDLRSNNNTLNKKFTTYVNRQSR
mgnify:CR=1 FL=1|tara:strand:+ start:233 stop:1165 length:933 start_codon:yes stop_codon:yes gene_type:complete